MEKPGVKDTIPTEYTNAKGKPHNIKLHLTKKLQFKIIFPAKYAREGINSRPACTFTNLLGTSATVYTRIVQELKAVVKQFRTVDDGKNWCQEKKTVTQRAYTFIEVRCRARA